MRGCRRCGAAVLRPVLSGLCFETGSADRPGIFAGADGFYYYTEGIKNNIMNGDPQQSVDLFKKVLEIDSTHAPTLFELATLTMSEPETALRYSLRANAADTGNIWYRTRSDGC